MYDVIKHITAIFNVFPNFGIFQYFHDEIQIVFEPGSRNTFGLMDLPSLS